MPTDVETLLLWLTGIRSLRVLYAPYPCAYKTADLLPSNCKLFYGYTNKWGSRAYYSNWFPVKFTYTIPSWLVSEDVTDKSTLTTLEFKHSEQYMMWAKALLFGDKKMANLILTQGNDPEIAKKLGKKVKGFDEDKWTAYARKIVEHAVYLKFSQNKKLREKLLESKEKEVFVEAASRDPIWGIGFSIDEVLGVSINEILREGDDTQKKKNRLQVEGNALQMGYELAWSGSHDGA